MKIKVGNKEFDSVQRSIEVIVNEFDFGISLEVMRHNLKVQLDDIKRRSCADQRKACAASAKIKFVDDDCVEVDKDSIINAPEPPIFQ